MLHDDALQQLIHDRRHEREREAQSERLARLARSRRPNRTSERASTAVLGHLLAARRHATP
jgi:hypothetical protein